MASLSGLSLTVEAPYERSLPVKIARSCRSQRGYHKYVASASCKAITGGDYDNAAYWLWRRRNALEDGYFPGISNRSNARMAKCVRAVGSSGFTEAEGGRRDVSKDALKTTPEISKKALGMQKNLLQQIAERKKLVASLKESIISTESNVISSSKPEESLADLDLLALNSVKLEGEAVSEFRTDIYAKSTSSKMPKISVVGGKGRPTTVEPQAMGATQVESPIAVALGLMRETDATVNNTVTVPLTVPETSKPLEAQVENLEAILIEEVEKQEGTSEEGNVKSPPLAGENAMNVILVSAECAPWSKAGGLGDVAGSLPKALARRGHRVMVVAPRYGLYAEAQQIGSFRRYQVDGQDMEVAYHHAYIDGVDFVFLDSGIFRNWNNNIYGGGREDILKRMVLLCKASVEVPWYVPCGGSCYGDGNLVFIANDWHTALLPVYLKAYYRDNGLMTYARSVLVIHNIAHQGRGPVADFRFVGLPGHYLDHFRLYDPVGGEHCNIFAAGIKAADRVVTVSHGYSWEVKTPEGGWGLHAIIGESDWKLRGIVNGIDMNDWNPEVDINLKSDGYTNYSLETLRTGKAQCKAALQRELGLPLRDDAPLVGFIGRLDYQKGIDLIEQAMPWMAGQDVQLVLLGTGRADLEEMLKRVQAEHPGKVRSWVGFSVKMAHRIIAGSDVLLMPSRFEPCGLNQLYAMNYGTIPVVHAVGGLRDTVQPFDPFTDSGHGWTFDRAEAQKLINALGNCFNTYRNHKGSWEGLQRRGMTQDLSWDNAALLYEEVLVAAKYQW